MKIKESESFSFWVAALTVAIPMYLLDSPHYITVAVSTFGGYVGVIVNCLRDMRDEMVKNE